MVGAAEGINLCFMGSNTEKFMAGANKFLFEQNMKNFGPWLTDSPPWCVAHEPNYSPSNKAYQFFKNQKSSLPVS